MQRVLCLFGLLCHPVIFHETSNYSRLAEVAEEYYWYENNRNSNPCPTWTITAHSPAQSRHAWVAQGNRLTQSNPPMINFGALPRLPWANSLMHTSQDSSYSWLLTEFSSQLHTSLWLFLTEECRKKHIPQFRTRVGLYKTKSQHLTYVGRHFHISKALWFHKDHTPYNTLSCSF